jgi:hypothetical protein
MAGLGRKARLRGPGREESFWGGAGSPDFAGGGVISTGQRRTVYMIDERQEGQRHGASRSGSELVATSK